MTFRLIILQEFCKKVYIKVDGYICRYKENSHAILHFIRDKRMQTNMLQVSNTLNRQ
ncbi:hypothetical protein YC2023_055485 [Brassica napus]